MSKGKSDEDVNPFGGFNILRGEFEAPKLGPDEPIEDDISSPDDTIVKEDLDEPIVDDITSLADKKLQEISDAKVTGKKVSPVVTKDPEQVTDDQPEGDSSVFKVFAKDLYEKGVIEFDDSDPDFEDSPEGIAKLVKKTVEKDKEDFKASLDDDFKKLYEFTQNGGKVEDFLKIYYSDQSWENFDIESEDAQKMAVAESLRLAGESDEDIDDMITEWNDNGSLAKRAKSALTKLQKYESTEKQRIVQEQELAAETRRRENEKYWTDFKDDLLKREDIMGFKVTPKVTQKLYDFITVVDKKTGKTGYEKALESKKDSTLLFALQAMNDFNVSSLEKQVRTKVNNEMQHLLENYSRSSKDKISKGRTDDNYGSNPFDSFRTAL